MNENIYLTKNNNKSSNGKDDVLVSIIILTYNGLFYTRKTLASIKKYTKLPYEIIIVDNASSDSTVEYLKNNCNVTIILNEKNLGFPAGCNQGISVAKGRYILILNNDVIVTENWIGNMLRYFWDPQVGIVVPITNKIHSDQLDNNCPQYKMIIDYVLEHGDDHIQEYATDNFIKRRGAFAYSNRITGFCMLIPMRVIETIGGLDERFGIGNFEDDDYSMRAILAGYKLIIAKDTFIYHFGSRSFALIGKEKYANLLDENRIKFTEKYGLYPEDLQEDISKLTKEIEIKYDISHNMNVFSSQKRLSVFVIVQDDITCIKKTMDSVIDIASGITLLNYGSQDDLDEKIYMYDPKIINIDNNEYNIWKYISSEIDCDWVLILNSGEEINVDSAVRILQCINNENVDAYSTTIHKYLKEDSFYKFNTSCQVRLLRNKNGFDYLNKQFGSILEFNRLDKQAIADSEITIDLKETEISWLRDLEIAVLEKLVKDDSKNLDHIYKLATELYLLDKYEESIKHLLSIVELYNKDNTILVNRKIEDVFLLLYRNYFNLKNYNESDKYIKYLEKSHSDDLDIKFTIAMNCYHKNEFRKAIIHFENLMKLLKGCENDNRINYHLVYLNLSNLYDTVGSVKQAIKCIQKAIDIKRDAITFYSYSQLLCKIGFYKDAEQMLIFALDCDPDFHKAKELLESIKPKL